MPGVRPRHHDRLTSEHMERLSPVPARAVSDGAGGSLRGKVQGCVLEEREEQN